MRSVAVAFLLTQPLALIAAFMAPRARLGAIPPVFVTLGALAVGFWFAFTADRDARRRLDRVKEAATADGDRRRLLSGHLLVLVAVLLRLEMITVLGLIVAVWGSGPRITVWFVVVVSILMVLAWPTEHKARLLLRRVEGA
jgi:hypothetical protein